MGRARGENFEISLPTYHQRPWKILHRLYDMIYDERDYVYKVDHLSADALVAAHLGSIRSLRNLLAAGVDVNVKVYPLGALLVAAAIGGHQHIVEFLLGAGGKTTDTTISRIDEAVPIAAFRGDITMLRTFFEWPKKRRLYSSGFKYIYSAIDRIAETGNLEIFRMLVELIPAKRARVIWCAERDAMDTVCLNGRAEFARCLVERELTREGKVDWSNDFMCRWYFLHSIGFRGQGGEWNSRTQTASRSGSVELVKYLINIGAAFGSRYHPREFENQPDSLVIAIRHGHLEIAQLLIESQDENGYFYPSEELGHALNAAAELGYIDIIKSLLRRGVSVTNDTGHQLIESSAFGGQENTLRFLLDEVIEKPVPEWEDGGYRSKARYLLEKYDLINSDSRLSNDESLRIPSGKDQEVIKLIPALGYGTARCRCGIYQTHETARSYMVKNDKEKPQRLM